MKLQIIDQNQKFSYNSLKDMIEQTNIQGLDYQVVAVFGSQSTGKSTLLNRLFHTQFDVMSDNKRQQTTHGIWLSVRDNTLVMDVEGTDGRERGEDQEFERKSALFSLAVAQIVIVNLWENMVGLYNGANIGLLKTVFEVNLQLFQSTTTKTCIVFVIRDFLGTQPLSELEQVLTESLEKVWNELQSNAAGSKLQDYFDFQFVALPHKILQAEKFEEEAQKLSLKFVKGSDGCFYREQYSRQIPVDGFSRYMESVWDKVAHNKDLDLPTQQQLLAQYRCDEIMNAEFIKFKSEIASQENEAQQSRVIENFLSLAQVRDKSLQLFELGASRYHAEVYQRKRSEYLQKLNSALHVIFLAQIKNLRKKAITEFKLKVQGLLKCGHVDSFAQQLVSAQDEALSYFSRLANEAVLPLTEWSIVEDVNSFNEELQEQSSKIRSEEMEKLGKRTIKQVNVAIVDGLLDLLQTSPQDLWQKVIGCYNDIIGKHLEQYQSKVQGLAASERELQEYVQWIREEAWDYLRAKIKEELSDSGLSSRLRSKFEQLFKYDSETGLPRVWSSNENIEPIYKTARDQSEELVSLYSKLQFAEDDSLPSILAPVLLEDPEYDDVEHVINLLSQSRIRELKLRFRKDADMIYVEVKRGLVSSFSEIPKGVWVLLLALGFNEMVAAIQFMLSSPILVVLLLVSSASGVLLYQSGLFKPLMSVGLSAVGPTIRMIIGSVMPVVDSLRVKVAEQLRGLSETLEQPVEMSPVKAISSTVAPQTPMRARVKKTEDTFFTPMRKASD